MTTFGFEGIDPPTSLYISRDDVLIIQSSTSIVAGETIQVTARLLLPVASRPGQPADSPNLPPSAPPSQGANIATFAQVVTPGVSPSSGVVQVPLAEGFLLSLAVQAATASSRGQTFVRCWLKRGGPAIGFGNQVELLLADYCTGAAPIAWPYGRAVYPTEGPGNIFATQVSNPAAGADWTVTVGGGRRWRLQSFAATLVTSASVANRNVRAVLQDGAFHGLWQGAAQQNIPASTTAVVAAAPGQFTSTVDITTVNLPLPSPCIIPAGGVIKVSTLNIQAGDQWAGIWLSVEELLDLI